METHVQHIYYKYLADFFLECEILRMKVVEKIRTPILRSKIVFRKSCRLSDNVEQYGT